MSASFQALPPPGLHPPGMGLPTGGSSGEGQDPSHSSSGSFGMVFIVLAIILVISAIACVLGRFCSKKSHKSHHRRTPKQGYGYGSNHYNHGHHHGGVYPRDLDLEFGFRSREGDIMPPLGFDPQERGASIVKVANHGGFTGDGMAGGMEHGGQHGEFP